jgi:hypothetical protein
MLATPYASHPYAGHPYAGPFADRPARIALRGSPYAGHPTRIALRGPPFADRPTRVALRGPPYAGRPIWNRLVAMSSSTGTPACVVRTHFHFTMPTAPERE